MLFGMCPVFSFCCPLRGLWAGWVDSEVVAMSVVLSEVVQARKGVVGVNVGRLALVALMPVSSA